MAAILADDYEKIFKCRFGDKHAWLARRRPLQCCHFGASLDKAARHRTMLEIKKRGRWKSDSSIARHEKSGILAQDQPDLNKCQLAFFEATDTSLEELTHLLGNTVPKPFRDPLWRRCGTSSDSPAHSKGYC